MTSKANAPSDLESPQTQEASDQDQQESAVESNAMEPMEASSELAADSAEDGASPAAKTRRPLTPEQHQRKILRDRERRALKSQEKAKAKAQQSSKPVPFDESLTQEQRDRPYRQRLSAMIQAADAARFNRVMESQRRRAEGKEKSVAR